MKKLNATMFRHQRGYFGMFPAGTTRVAAASVPDFSASSFAAFDSAIPPTDAGCRIQLLANGGVQRFLDNGPDTVIGSWGDGSLDITDYDFRVDTVSGSPSYTGTQAADTWINGFANMYWGAEETGTGISSFFGTIRVRPAGGGADFDTAGFSTVAEATP